MIAGFQSYVIIYYVFSGDAEQGAAFVGHSGLLQAVSGLAVIAFVTWLATRIGKRRAFFVSTGVSMRTETCNPIQRQPMSMTQRTG